MNLIQGDCLEKMKEMSENSVDYAFTSPPYNRKRNDKYENYNDNKDNYFEFLKLFTDELLRITKKGIFINIQTTYYNRHEIYKYIGQYSDKIQEIFIWGKSNPMPASGKSITNAVEYFIYLSDERPKSNNTYTKNLIITSVNSNMPSGHKAVMKQDVADWFIKNFTSPNDTVIDCFMGVGTTGISCVNNNCNFIGIEIDEKYFNSARQKINNTLNNNINE